MAAPDYYALLGVSREASDEELKRAYRQLARKYHPDVNGGDPAAETRFKEINEAYSVLSDREKRARYDQFGSADGPGAGGFGFSGDFFDMGGLGDIFESFFGGGRASRTGPVKGRDLRLDLEITLEEAFQGVERDITIPREENCPTCHGSGAKAGTGPVACKKCGGSGQVRVQRGPFLTVNTCPVCHGMGKMVEHPCSDCRGTGRVRRTRTRKVSIPAGVGEGMRIRVGGEGEDGDRGGPPGDLYIFVHEKRHPTFERDGLHLYTQVKIGFSQAALGTEVTIPTLDGKESPLHIPEGIQPGTVLTLKGKGMPQPKGGQVGDVRVEVQISVPTRLSHEEKELLQKWAQLRHEPVTVGAEKSFFQRVKDAFR